MKKINRLEAHKSLVIKEQELIADERVLQVKREMQIIIDENLVLISVYLEKLQHKENDHRKLYLQMTEFKQMSSKHEGGQSAWMK